MEKKTLENGFITCWNNLEITRSLHFPNAVVSEALEGAIVRVFTGSVVEDASRPRAREGSDVMFSHGIVEHPPELNIRWLRRNVADHVNLLVP